MTEKIIALDCAPGLPRPSDLIQGVLKGTRIEVGEPVSRLFGQWTWEISEKDYDKFKTKRQIIWSRIEDLYFKGKIRYAELSE
jgi:hypothetical protein|tara:strand:- start:444 stop:692 length:249 start_codon:yes stop_codon:yes gene_type:complete